MGRASRTTARSALAAVAVMVTALAAFLATTQPALAAPVSRTGEQGTNARTAVATARLSSGEPFKMCVITSESPPCLSTDPELEVYSTNTGDTAACTFTWKMYWDDGTTQIVTRDGADGTNLIFKARHHYREPREKKTYIVSFLVRWHAVSVTGGCTIGSGDNVFQLAVLHR
jgi:hypothetical protein